MAGPQAFAQPLTTSLNTEPDVLFLELTRALLDQFGKQSVACCQQTSPGKYQITFTTPTLYTRALTSGLKFRNTILPLEAVTGAAITVTVRNAPYAMPADHLTTALRAYGKVLTHTYEYPDPTLPVTNGNRKIRILMSTPIPNFFRVGSYQLMALYPGVKKVCRRCSLEGHVGRDCPSFYCTTCRSWTHTPDCPNNKTTPQPEPSLLAITTVPAPLPTELDPVVFPALSPSEPTVASPVLTLASEHLFRQPLPPLPTNPPPPRPLPPCSPPPRSPRSSPCPSPSKVLHPPPIPLSLPLPSYYTPLRPRTPSPTPHTNQLPPKPTLFPARPVHPPDDEAHLSPMDSGNETPTRTTDYSSARSSRMSTSDHSASDSAPKDLARPAKKQKKKRVPADRSGL